MTPITTDWTAGGHRIIAADGANGCLVITVQSETNLITDGKPGRHLWTLAQLVVPSAINRSEGRRAVASLLMAYDDEELEASGVKAFMDLFAALPEAAPPPPGATPGPQGTMN